MNTLASYVHFFRIPIEDLFYKGKNPRGVKSVKPSVTEAPVVTEEATTSGDDDEVDDYYDVFDDFYDYGETEEEETAVEPKSEKKVEKEEEERGSFLDDLPSDIYCDLVATLDKRLVDM